MTFSFRLAAAALIAAAAVSFSAGNVFASPVGTERFVVRVQMDNVPAPNRTEVEAKYSRYGSMQSITSMVRHNGEASFEIQFSDKGSGNRICFTAYSPDRMRQSREKCYERPIPSSFYLTLL